MSYYDWIKEYFPYLEYRPYQKEVLYKILHVFINSKKFVFLQAPTGSGKSAIAYTLSKFYSELYETSTDDYHYNQSTEVLGAYILTATKSLQDQYIKEFSNNPAVATLKGQNAYECRFYPEYCRGDTLREKVCEDFEQAKNVGRPIKKYCNEGLCKLNAFKSYCKDMCEGTCYYKNSRKIATDSPIAVMNFYVFFTQMLISAKKLREQQEQQKYPENNTTENNKKERRFDKRNLLVVDEAHNLESNLLNFMSITLSDKFFPNEYKFHACNNIQSYLTHLDKEIEIETRIEEQLKKANDEEKPKIVNMLNQQKNRYEEFKRNNPNDFIVEFKHKSNYNTITFKPIFGNKYAPQRIFSWGKKVLLMSASLTNKEHMCKSLGINPDNAEFIDVASTFPASRRPIKLIHCGSMCRKYIEGNIDKLCKTINTIMDDHSSERGIIHTHSNKILAAIYNSTLISNQNKKRLLKARSKEINEETGEKLIQQEILNQHKENESSVLISPSMAEGVDLKDELARFQISAKVPYPSLGDKQTKARKDRNPELYNITTASKIIQTCGRAVRSPKDQAITYLLDSHYHYFITENWHLFPDWFKESLQLYENTI